jgi:hypothetical protein
MASLLSQTSSRAPTAFAFAAEVQKKQQDRRGGADHTRRKVLTGK